MKLLLVLLLITVSLCNAQNFTQLTTEILSSFCPYNDLYGLAQDCNSTKVVGQNRNLLPALIGIGWDPVKGQVRLPFLNMTYYNNNTYISNSGTAYNFPDQVTLVKKNLTQGNISSSLFESIDDFLRSVSLNRTTVTSGFLNLPVASLSYFVEYFSGGSNNIVVSTDYYTTYQLSIDPNISLIPEVQEIIDSLPDYYDHEAYNEFIEYWGSGIVISGNFGGLIQQSVMIKSCFGDVNLLDQAEIYLLKQTEGKTYQNENFTAGFAEHSYASAVEVYGGDPTLIQLSQWNRRVLSFDDFPVLTRANVIPITNFIADPNKKKIMQIAIDAYLLNESNSRNQIREAWYQILLGPKIITFATATMGNNNTNYPGQYVLIYPNMIASSNLSANETDNFPGTYYFTSVSSPGSCGRNSNGYVYSIWTDKGNSSLIGYGIEEISTSTGIPVRSGCSIIQAELYMIPEQHPYYWSERIYCCMNCIPTALPPEYKEYDTSYANTGLFSCQCPAF